MKKVEKLKEEKSIDNPMEGRRELVKKQLEEAIMEREKLTSLIYKCQGALELLDSMENKEEDSD